MKTEHFNIKADSKNDKYLNNTKTTELICYMSYEYDMKHELYRYVFLQCDRSMWFLRLKYMDD